MKKIEDAISLRCEFDSITQLRANGLADAFVVQNFVHICSIVGIELNNAQKEDLIEEIGQVGWLTLCDVKLFLDRLKKHKFYRKDYQEMIQEFWRYVDDRLNAAGTISEREHRLVINNLPEGQRVRDITHVKELAIFKIRNNPQGGAM